MRTGFILLIGLAFNFLSACAQIHSIEDKQHNKEYSSAQFITTAGDHHAQAEYYEKVTIDLEAKLQEQKQLLHEYEERSYYFGAKAQDVRSHTSANIRYYEKLLEKNLRKVTIHRKMANQQEIPNVTTNMVEPTTPFRSISNGEFEPLCLKEQVSERPNNNC